MGMDVYGKKPNGGATCKHGQTQSHVVDASAEEYCDGPVGTYFRNNVWWWHPLAAYCCEIAPKIASKCKHWHSNDGAGLDAADSAALAAALHAEILSGRTAAHATKYEAARAAMLREKCRWCDGTGIRTDSVGAVNGMPERALDADVAKEVGREKGWCNACNGRGSCEAAEAHYPFSVENVQAFAEFLEHCGGFEIL